MSPEGLFAAANTLALLSWIALAVLPRRRVVSGLATGFVVPLLLSAVYLVLLASRLGHLPEGASFSSLDGVAALMSDRTALLAGWIHYLAFDLFIGSWQARDAERRGIPHALVLPCLLLTFMLGPTGLLAYFAVRAARTAK